MSRRDRLRAHAKHRSATAHGVRAAGRRAATRWDAGAARTRRRSLDRLTLALLPLRVFLGVTFVYAGVDKLIDPTFLQATGPGSIGAQLDGVRQGLADRAARPGLRPAVPGRRSACSSPSPRSRSGSAR